MMYQILKREKYKDYNIYVSRVCTENMHWFCGYVEVPEDHPFYGLYGELEDVLDVHGGLTYGDTAHFADGYLIGFDCAHYGDSPEVQDEAYTLSECKKLVDQLIKIKELSNQPKS